jgi:hypothetical protein
MNESNLDHKDKEIYEREFVLNIYLNSEYSMKFCCSDSSDEEEKDVYREDVDRDKKDFEGDSNAIHLTNTKRT